MEDAFVLCVPVFITVAVDRDIADNNNNMRVLCGEPATTAAALW